MHVGVGVLVLEVLVLGQGVLAGGQGGPEGAVICMVGCSVALMWDVSRPG